MYCSNNIFTNGAATKLKYLRNKGYQECDIKPRDGQLEKTVIFQVRTSGTQNRIGFYFDYNDTIEGTKASLQKTYSPLLRLVIGIRAFCITILTLGISLSSKDVRDEWKKCIGGKSVVHIYQRGNPIDQQLYDQMIKTYPDARQIDIED